VRSCEGGNKSVGSIKVGNLLTSSVTVCCSSRITFLRINYLVIVFTNLDRFCGLVVIVLGYGSGGPGSIPGTTRKKSSGSGTGSIQPREYN
jgi:hypothetical protein